MNGAAYPRVSRSREKRTFFNVPDRTDAWQCQHTRLFGIEKNHEIFVCPRCSGMLRCKTKEVESEKEVAVKTKFVVCGRRGRNERNSDQDAFDDIIVELNLGRNSKSNYCRSTAQIKPLLAQLIQNPTKQTNN